MAKKMTTDELFKMLRMAVNDNDSEMAHSYYDRIMEQEIRNTNKKLHARLLRARKGIDFFYA